MPAEMVTITTPMKALRVECLETNEVALVTGFMFDYLLEIWKKRCGPDVGIIEFWG